MTIKMRPLLVLCAALALTVGVSTATAGGGNSDNAKLCQKGGWQDWVRADLTPFVNTGGCVSYAARGGIFTEKSAAQAACEALGGTFGTTPDLVGVAGTVVWVCNGTPEDPSSGLLAACTDDGGTTITASASPGPFDSTCWHPNT
ncbi:MAG TPA: hypothetical protein VIM05_00330 [Gaiellaceae bacterium]